MSNANTSYQKVHVQVFANNNKLPMSKIQIVGRRLLASNILEGK